MELAVMRDLALGFRSCVGNIIVFAEILLREHERGPKNPNARLASFSEARKALEKIKARQSDFLTVFRDQGLDQRTELATLTVDMESLLGQLDYCLDPANDRKVTKYFEPLHDKAKALLESIRPRSQTLVHLARHWDVVAADAWTNSHIEIPPRGSGTVEEASQLTAARPERKPLTPQETKTMVPEEIRRKRDALAGVTDQVNWCDNDDLEAENMEGAGPGGWLNVFGWYVVGAIGGSGNSIVVRADDPAVYYACHEWYGGDITNTSVDFQDFQEVGARLESSTRQDCMRAKWVSVPFTADGVRRSLFQLAPSIDEFRERADEMCALIDKID